MGSTQLPHSCTALPSLRKSSRAIERDTTHGRAQFCMNPLQNTRPPSPSRSLKTACYSRTAAGPTQSCSACPHNSGGTKRTVTPTRIWTPGRRAASRSAPHRTAPPQHRAPAATVGATGTRGRRREAAGGGLRAAARPILWGPGKRPSSAPRSTPEADYKTKGKA